IHTSYQKRKEEIEMTQSKVCTIESALAMLKLMQSQERFWLTYETRKQKKAAGKDVREEANKLQEDIKKWLAIKAWRPSAHDRAMKLQQEDLLKKVALLQLHDLELLADSAAKELANIKALLQKT